MARPPITIREFRGVNKLDRFSIGPTYAMSTKNLTSDKYPALTTRPGLSILGAAIGTKVLGLGVWKDTEIHAVFNDGTWRKWSGSAWSAALASGLSTTAEWTFTNFKGGLTGINLIGTNGVDTMRRYDGTTVTTIAGAPATANYVTQFADRCWCAVGNELHASAYRDATNWTIVSVPEVDTDSWYTIIETTDGESVNGIEAGMTKLVITKPSSNHELYGYAPSDYTVRPVTYDVGALNNKSMIVLNGVLYLLDSTGWYAYGGGTLPDRRFSLRVQSYIDNINQTAKGLSALGTDGNKIYASIPVTSSTSPDTVIVYDPKHDTFYVWENMTALCFAQMGANFYLGDNAGKVHQLTGTADNGSSIASEWVSAPFTAQSMAQLLRWLTAWITAYVITGSTLSVYISPTDSGDVWTLVKTVTANGIVESTPMYMSAVANAANARYMRVKFSMTGPVDIYEFTREEEQNPLK